MRLPQMEIPPAVPFALAVIASFGFASPMVSGDHSTSVEAQAIDVRAAKLRHAAKHLVDSFGKSMSCAEAASSSLSSPPSSHDEAGGQIRRFASAIVRLRGSFAGVAVALSDFDVVLADAVALAGPRPTEWLQDAHAVQAALPALRRWLETMDLTLRDVETRLQRADAASWSPLIPVDDGTLAAALTQRTPGVVGGSARIAHTRIPVWTLENYRRLGATEEQLLEMYPGLRDVDVHAARAYAARHVDEIERDIAENDAA
jgi:uncharacterized protein (DUF433 family)